MSRRCSRSTATRSPTAPTTRCRSRCAAPPACPSGAIVGFANFLLRLWEAEQPRAVRRRLGLRRRADLPARGVPRLPERARLRPRARSSSSTSCRSSSGRSASPPAKQPGYEADDFLAAAVAAGGGARRRHARRHLRPRRVPARQRADDGPPAGEGRLRARADRACGGPRALRRRPGAGAGLHRPARRPVRQAPGREGRRPEDGGVAPRRVRHARGRARRRTVLGAAGGAAPLPANSDDGRLCPSPLPSRSNSQLGGGVHHRRSRGGSGTSPGGSSAG